VRYKSGAGGLRTREALLDPKSHRRVNRRQVCAFVSFAAAQYNGFQAYLRPRQTAPQYLAAAAAPCMAPSEVCCCSW
jgi:hypothetical protein